MVSEEVWYHQLLAKKENEKLGHIRPENGFYEKLNALKFVPQQELSREQAYWLPANETASQASNPDRPVTPFIHTRPPPSQVLANLQKANTHSRTVYTEKLSALTTQHTKLQAQVTGKTSSGPSTSETPKVLAPGMYNLGVKPTSGASKPVPKRAPRNHSSLPAKSANARRVEAHHRTLNKKNRVDSNLLVKHSTKRLKRQPKKEWKPIKNVGKPIKRVWKPISKLVANSKPQWKPTGRHFSLFEKYPLTRIMEPTDMPIELPPSASSSPQITMVSRFTDHKLSDRKAGSKGISGCSRHMTGDRARLINFVEKFIGTVRFGNDEYASIVGYGDYKLGDTIISRVYYVEGLKHNLFSVGQFCDGGLEVAFRRSIQRGLPMLKYDKRPKCVHLDSMGKANGKSKKASHPLKTENTNTEVLHTLHMDLCGPMRTESINGKKYVLVIVDDYTRFGWVRFLRTKDETPQVIEKFIVKTQRALNATVRFVRTDNGTEFVNKTLDGWFESVGISHETSVPRSPQQNGVVERRNRTLMEAARTMLIFAKAPLFLWAEAVATACYTLNRSLVHTLHGKTYYELLKGKKPNLQYFRVFGSLCYPTNDYDDVGKLKAKADIGIFVGYAPTKKAYRIYNKRTRKIQETVHVAFDELTEGLTSVQTSSGLAPQQNAAGSALVKDARTTSVPLQRNSPRMPMVHTSTTGLSQKALDPAVTENLLPHQIPLPDTSDSDVENTVDHVTRELVLIFEESFAPVARLEAIRLFIAHAKRIQSERPNLDEDKGGKLIDPTRFRGFIHMRRSTSVQLHFLGQSALLSGHNQKAEKYCHTHSEAEYIATRIRMLCSNPLFRTISENQCLLQMLNVMEIRRRYIIKAFQIPTDSAHLVKTKISVCKVQVKEDHKVIQKVKLKQVKGSNQVTTSISKDHDQGINNELPKAASSEVPPTTRAEETSTSELLRPHDLI
ncbi:retrovirus-related pol polyprotein from transposon TNT 1-94 [Tanacetum coccineum]|uniref:Retrovirus-related pol polyprotein from transposon TNT 1-94 n=1 Tax=Tanacetum coccineum TaxID=301880 RepID=A0ABQ5CKC0_9ASTR